MADYNEGTPLYKCPKCKEIWFDGEFCECCGHMTKQYKAKLEA